MKVPKRPPFLHVVEPKPVPEAISADDFTPLPSQHTLFANTLPNLIVFIHFESVSESDFLTTILNTKPKFILDLRVAPRFDIGSLNRKLVLSIFQQVGARYFDVTGNLGIRSPRDARLNPEIIVGEIKKRILIDPQQIAGPLVILLGQNQSDPNFENQLGRSLESLSTSGWELMRVPADISKAHDSSLRELVFISHANPEDNDFVKWLGANLTILGYRVWSDVTRLIGGEEFWEDIETAIRDHSSKVVVCLSRVSQTKKGVLDEISCAVSVERSKNIESFVVPIRVDDLPYSEIRANIGRKNVIDFNENWASGLSALVKVLDRDNVPRPVEDGRQTAGMLTRISSSSNSQLIEREDLVLSNWFRIIALPLKLHFSEFSGSNQNLARLRGSLNLATFEHYRLLGSFAHASELQLSAPIGINLTARGEVDTVDFLKGKTGDLPQIKVRAAHNHLKGLVRSSIEKHFKELGLVGFQTASKRVAWFAPVGLIPDNLVKYVDFEGKKRRKSLVGRSEKRKVFWHFAIEIEPILVDPIHIVFKSHVIFSEDGKTPLTNDSRMHSLRRGFCRSWWNDRWRDLTISFASFVANGNEIIAVGCSDNSVLQIQTKPMEFISSLAWVKDADEIPRPERDVVDSDWLDDPELEDTEIDSAADHYEFESAGLIVRDHD